MPCRRAGVTILTGRRVTSLLREDGAVIGVETDAGTHKAERLLAGTGVVLASGDFSSADQAYKERFLSGPLLAISGINPTSTGDGQRMGEAVGAEVTNGDLAWGPEIRFTAPPRPSIVSRMPTHRLAARTLLLAMKLAPQWLLRPILLRFVTTFLAPSHKLFEEGAILVNRDGERFCDELNRPQDSIGYQREQAAWIVFDDAIAQRFTAWPYYVSTAPGVGYAYVPDYARSRPDLYSTAPDIEGLAAKIGVPAAAMRKSLEDHNASLASDEHRKPLEKGPFHAIGPAKSWIVFTEGGLRIDESFRVLDKAREPIPGLYAAGSAGQGGVILEGHGHHLGWAFTSGLLAGRNAAGTAAQHNRGSSTRSIQ